VGAGTDDVRVRSVADEGAFKASLNSDDETETNTFFNTVPVPSALVSSVMLGNGSCNLGLTSLWYVHVCCCASNVES